MFGDMGAILKMLGNRDKILAEFAKFKDSLGTITADGDAGGGLVTVRANGRMEVVSCHLREGSPVGGDHAALAELVVAATNSALAKARVLVAEAATKVAGGLDIPPALMKQLGGLPGLS